MPGNFLYSFDNPAVAEAAARAGVDPLVYFLGCALSADLNNLSDESEIDPAYPLDLYNAVGVLGEIAAYYPESVHAVIAGLAQLIEDFSDNPKVGSAETLALTLAAGLQMGFLNEYDDPRFTGDDAERINRKSIQENIKAALLGIANKATRPAVESEN